MYLECTECYGGCVSTFGILLWPCERCRRHPGKEHCHYCMEAPAETHVDDGGVEAPICKPCETEFLQECEPVAMPKPTPHPTREPALA